MNICPPYSQSNFDDMVQDVSSGDADALNESLDGAACNVKTCLVTPHQDDKDNHSNDTSGNDDADLTMLSSRKMSLKTKTVSSKRLCVAKWICVGQ